MTIPSVLDSTLAPPGAHVVQLFTQYTPYALADGRPWDEKTKQQYADTGTRQQYLDMQYNTQTDSRRCYRPDSLCSVNKGLVVYM